MRLLEPLGLLQGRAAEAAIGAGLARQLPGGRAFFLARCLDADGAGPVLPATALPADWACRLPAELPPWAGFGDGVAVMGILNVTPDSFSDGGRHADPVAAGLAMAEAGADIVDVGGESTRPGAAPLNPLEEQARVVPVIRALAAAGCRVSVDTRNAGTMAAALAAGATIVNDVSALAHDPAVAGVVAEAGCPVVLMHMRGTPATMARYASYADVAAEVTRELAARVAAALAAGIARDRICLDPGIGFAKDARHNLDLLRRLPVLWNLGCQLLVGASRKRFLGELTGVARPADRLAGSVAAALFAAAQGATIVRVHDVAATVQALRVQAALAEPRRPAPAAS